ncbi:unnamed protein product [Rotaria sp. Silwood2]|nr:unnamed protein product [Rotaria sp. Silwood2]CAF4517093.1 unnamed protein product [Rotaria sp. Silwood2]CAF4754590.1 unnamed protein product [Rotaria sp. Silwood2]
MPFYNVLTRPQNKCGIQPPSYQAFFSIWNLVIWSWIPTIAMLVFGGLTVQHVHQGRKRLAPTNNPNNSQSNQKKSDRQLIRMMFVQALVFGLTTTVNSIVGLYVARTTSSTDTAVKLAIYNYLLNVSSSMALIGPCMAFYLFTLSSQIFRRELLQLFHRICYRRVTPTDNIQHSTATQRY